MTPRAERRSGRAVPDGSPTDATAVARLRRTLRAGLILIAIGLLAALAAPAEAAVNGGTVLVNRGVLLDGGKQVELGLTRTQVVRLLGRPVYENANGYLQYGAGTTLFDLYLRSGRVALIGMSGGRFCLRGGSPCLLKPNGGAALRRRFGARLQRRDEQSGTSYVVSGLFRGKRAFTSFDLSTGVLRPASRIVMVFIGRP